jgi:hypothetical protein
MLEICPETGFRWGESYNSSISVQETGIVINQRMNKHEMAAAIIRKELMAGKAEATAIQALLREYGIRNIVL